MLNCPLCKTANNQFFHQDKKRAFFRCDHCHLIFADPKTSLAPALQQKRFSQKQQNKQQQISQFILPILKQLHTVNAYSLKGLNFGRVVDQVILNYIESEGHQLLQFDPFMAPNHQLLKQEYDFITCYQVFEHFKRPAREWALLVRMLKPNAWLCINTKLLISDDFFAKWHHKNNLTHVSFYQKKTFEYLANISNLSLLFISNELILMQKTAKPDIKAH